MKKEIIITILLLAILASGCSKKDAEEKTTDTSLLTTEETVAPSDSDDTTSPTESSSTDSDTLPSSSVTESSVSTSETNKGGTLNPEDFVLGKYTTFGYTKLSITDIMVFNSSYPGEDNVVVFTPGDVIMINLWCNAEACMDSKLYVVPAGTEHKNSYTSSEAIIIEDMFFFFESSAGQVVSELTIPEIKTPGVYEFRFLCEGIEEGFISFIIE